MSNYDYENFYKKYPVNIHDDPARHSAIAALCRGQVIDLGCGTGTLSDYYPGVYNGFDISNEAIEKAHAIRRVDALFQVADCANPKDIPFECADTIVISEFLEHIENDDELLYAIMSKAKKGTRLIVSVPNDRAFNCDEHVRWFTYPIIRNKFERFGALKFINWIGMREQIIMVLSIGEVAQKNLGLVMMCKNEELGLENAVLSAMSSVDEIIIGVDNSSSDKTRDIAEKYADKVVFFDWKDDFSYVRNYVDSFCSTDFRLFLDGHEELKIRDSEMCFKIDIYNGLLCDIKMETGLIFQSVRIYRNGVQFIGAVHEKPKCDVVGYFSGIEIQHKRDVSQSTTASKERTKQRNDMIPRIMGAQLKNDPKNIRALFHLFMWSCEMGYRVKSSIFAWRYAKNGNNGPELWFVLFTLAILFYTKKNNIIAWYITDICEELMPGRWELRKLKGLICYQRGLQEMAIEWLMESESTDETCKYYRPWKKDSAGTFNLVGECYFQIGNYYNAYLAFDNAARNAPNDIYKSIMTKRAELLKQMAAARVENNI